MTSYGDSMAGASFGQRRRGRGLLARGRQFERRQRLHAVRLPPKPKKKPKKTKNKSETTSSSSPSSNPSINFEGGQGKKGRGLGLGAGLRVGPTALGSRSSFVFVFAFGMETTTEFCQKKNKQTNDETKDERGRRSKRKR